MNDLTKDAVLADADYLDRLETQLIGMDADVALDREPNSPGVVADHLRRLAPLLDVTGEEGLREQIAAVLSDALLNEYGARMDLVDELAGRIAPLITARIAQARAEERERAADIADTIGGATADEKAMGKNIGDYGEGYIAACDNVAVWIRGDDNDFLDRAREETTNV